MTVRQRGGVASVKDAGEFAKGAIDKGVAFAPGAPLYAHAPDPATLRLSLATADVAKIEE